MCVCCGTFDVLGQGLPRAGVLDAVSTPGGEELDQPGRGRVRHGGLQAAAAQDHQRVLLRVQPGGGRHTPGEEPEADRRRFEPEPEHPCGPDRDTSRAESEPSDSWRGSAEKEQRAPRRHESGYVCFSAESRRLTPSGIHTTASKLK